MGIKASNTAEVSYTSLIEYCHTVYLVMGDSFFMNAVFASGDMRSTGYW